MPSREEPPEPIRALRAERERLEREGPGRSGRERVRALTAAMDAAVRALWAECVEVDRRLALVALGSYGRAELCPGSDVDLMVLHGGRSAAPEVGRRLFYGLWDAGLTVGHAIRTTRDCLRLAAANLEVETSLLDARLVAGDAELFEELRAAVLRQARRRGPRLARALAEATRARWAREGHASALLEPSLKEGAGGLRDRALLGWLAGVFDLADDEDRLEAATDLLLRVRWELHRLAGRRTDILLLAHQEGVARALGHAGEARAAVDALLREVSDATREVEFRAATALAEVLGRTARRADRRSLAPGVVVEAGLVRAAARPSVTEDPAFPMRLAAAAAAEDLLLAAETVAWLREQAAAAPSEIPWSDEARRAFLSILRRGEAGGRALEALDRTGLLVRYLPEWAGVRCRPQHNAYHRFTVDRHLLATVAEACRLADDPAEPLARDVWRDLADPDRLLLACLLHDIGKGAGDDHSIAGEAIARRVLERIGLTGPAAEDVAWLVRHHLRLVDTATRRDATDENLVVETAAGIGEVQRLAMLYLLSVADGRATGPAAWSPWRSALVAELFTKVLHVVERGELVGRDASELVRLRTAELRQALARYPEEVVERHLALMPRAWVLAFPTEALIRHVALMASAPGPAEVRTHVSRTEAPGVYELVVVARDRPGLFSKVSGALALNGINVLSAQAFTREDGVALEVFRVEGAHEREVDEARWRRVADDAARALAGRISLDVRIAEKREAYARPSRGRREPPRVVVDNRASDFATVVEVHATDRVGLLYAITRALADLELDIHTAKVATYGDDVVDVFYVRDADGQKVTDPEQIREIERTVLHRIGG
jgi:[protein-PII] uridylyltransferase